MAAAGLPWSLGGSTTADLAHIFSIRRCGFDAAMFQTEVPFMRRKRLQHAADTLCQMFCGWRLVNSFEEITRIGTGTLKIDAISGSCKFNDQEIASIRIAGELNAWLNRDLEKHSIPVAEISRAELTATLTVSRVQTKQRRMKTYFFDSDGKHIAQNNRTRCEITCHSEIATDEAVYRSELKDIEEWPDGWLGKDAAQIG